MVWQIAAAAGIGALGSIFGAKEQSDAARYAADAQSRAAEQQLALQRQIYEDQRNLQQPYYQMGLQGMYGPTGLSNLLGITTPAGYGGSQQAQPAQQAQSVAQPQNAFSQYASGTYGTTSPQAAAQQESDQYMSYTQQSPDLLNAFNSLSQKDIRDIASTQYDADGDGRISMGEYGKFHYDRYGAAEGRQLPAMQTQTQVAPPAQTQPIKNPGVVANGDGSYGQTNEGSQLAVMGEPAGPVEGPMTETLRSTPGYMFMQDETRRMREGSAAARGELLSGGAIAEADRQVLGLADQTYQQSVNNNFNLANLGMGAAAQIQNAGTNFGIGASNSLTNSANAQANGYYGQANAFNAGLQGVTDSVMGGVGLYGAKNGWFS